MTYKKLKPIKNKIIGCATCTRIENKLSVYTRLANWFGGWSIHKNGKLFYEESCNTEILDCKTLFHFEKLARLEKNGSN